MDVQIDYANDVITIRGIAYSLESFRIFLTKNFRILVERFKIGSHISKGSRVISYDWDAILTAAITLDIHFEYKAVTAKK